MRPGTRMTRILKLLERGAGSAPVIAEILRDKPDVVSAACSDLYRIGQIVGVGEEVPPESKNRKPARLYALKSWRPGDARLASALPDVNLLSYVSLPDRVNALGEKSERPRERQRRRGSGVIAPRPYATGFRW